MEYLEFLEKKKPLFINESIIRDKKDINPVLFDFQNDIVRWSLKKGRSCVFAGTGLGKTFMQCEWAKHVVEYTQGIVLIVAPLAVSKQTVREAKTIDIDVKLARTQEDIHGNGIYITNYEMLHHFDMDAFSGIVLDESSVLKAADGKTRNEIIESCKSMSFKLACTATPSPNDYMELGNHSEFVGAMTMAEMLSMYFVHDGGETAKWRLKGHAEVKFWEWVASWAVMMTRPSDLGYDDKGFDLPPLRYHQITVDSANTGDALFALDAKTLQERQAARRNSIDDRVNACADIVNASDEPWIVWCGLNSESEMLTKKINDATEVKGSDSSKHKEDSMLGFADGTVKKLVSKASICGFGMNFQICNKMAFVGLSDSFEQYYQAIRRCWRFGQKNPVDVYIITSESEGAVVKNIERKQEEFETMRNGMITATQEIAKENIRNMKTFRSEYAEETQTGEDFEIHLGDSCEVIKKIPDNSIHYSIFSPPFASLYTYSDSERDMGNCRSDDDFMFHFRYLVKDLFRVIMPGRLLSFHCMDLPKSKVRDGIIGVKDFRGMLIRLFERAGFVLHSQVVIWKDPVTAMQRTKAIGLLHKQLKKDSCMSRQGIPDYLVTMRKPGDNPERVTHTNETFPVAVWQRYASPVWMDINPSDTLQRESAREEKDEKHICPLQLEVIRRGLELWTNPGDTVLSPFAGIGSEGFESVKMGRKFIGIELKRSYFEQAVRNLHNAEHEKKQKQLF